MEFTWDESCRAFNDAAGWFVQTSAKVGDRWEEPGLGEWDVRALVGHTTRALLTVESYLERPANSVEVTSAAGYYRKGRQIAAGPDIAERGRKAGASLGTDPATSVMEIAERVLPLVATKNGTEVIATLVGGMRLADYLPTRTFELAVHTADLAAALGLPLDIPASAASQALRITGDLTIGDGKAGALLLAVTGRTGLPDGFTVL